MKKYLVIMFSLLSAHYAFATTYLTYWVNQTESDSLIQGDLFAWEYDVSQVGGSATVSIYADINLDGLIDENDALIVRFSQSDGGLPNGGPSDSSITPDGVIYSSLGSFGFAPATYIFHIEDEQDHSTVFRSIFIEQKDTISVWATGTLSIENITPPNSALANQMIIAEPDDMELGLWSGLTDENGDYTIILPDSAINSLWQIGVIDENQLTGYAIDPSEYEGEPIFVGENSPFDFNLTPLSTIVYGNIYDEQGTLVDLDDYGYLQNLNTENGVGFAITAGTYTAYAVFAEGDIADVPFRMHFDGNNFIPDYLIPDTWNNSYYQFNLSERDSLNKDIHLLETDSIIHVYVTQDEGAPDDIYRIEARADSGYTYSYNDVSGYSQIFIKSGYNYNIRLNEDVNNVSTLPDGYHIENGNDRSAVAGDTVRFNLTPASSTLSGQFTVDENYIELLDTDNFQIQAYHTQTDVYYSGYFDFENFNYVIPVPNGEFDVELNNWTMDFLTMPAKWEGITATDETIDTLDFNLAYTHATLSIQLINAPASVFDDQRWWNITTNGEYPWVYQTYTEIEGDTTYNFRVCEGDWYVPVPDFGPDYTPLFEDSIITVTAGETDYALVIEYLNPSAINQNTIIPKEFIVKQNYPNPFNPVTNFKFGLPKQSHVTLEVFNISGEKVATIINGPLSSGMHTIPWNASHLASGMYVFRLQADQKVESRKLLLIK